MPLLDYQSNQVHYQIYGSGSSLMIALHGFADTGALFSYLEGVWGDQYTIIALDLPFHGATIWQKKIYTADDIYSIIGLLLKQFEKQKCSLCCHSMGGRILLGVLPFIKEKIEEIFFFATAGMSYTFTASNFWWPLWLRQYASKKLIESNFLISIFDWSYKLKLLNKATYLIFKMQLELPRRRARFLHTWVALYYFPMRFTFQHIRLLNQEKIPTYFFFGEKDKITPGKQAAKIVKKINNADLIICKGNHFFVKDQLIPALKTHSSQRNKTSNS